LNKKKAMIGAIRIDLTEEDASLFREFRRHQDIFQSLVTLGVFNTRGGAVTIHFNSQGQIARIDKNETVFYRSAKP